MLDQALSALFAFLAGTILALVLFVPFVFINYRRHGRLSPARILLWVAFLVYAMALWTYTLLPLPDPEQLRCTTAQLRPFQFVQDIQAYDIAGPSALLHNPAVIQVALNVLLFVPLGFFLKTLWGRGIITTTAVGFGLTLLIETTQLTGVWGIYPCSYRLFDVDDLLANTAGALLGAVLAGLLTALRRRIYPDRPQSVSPRITVARRLTGMVCDGLAMVLLGTAVAVASNAWQLYVLSRDAAELDQNLTQQLGLWVPFVVIAILTVTTGRTVGDHAVRLHFSGTWTGAGVPLQYALRYVAGIGGFQLLGLLSPADLLFVVLSVVAVFFTRDRRGLPGLLSATTLKDDAAQGSSEHV